MPSLVRCCAPMIGMLSSRFTAPALLLMAYAVMLAAPSAAQEPAAETVPADWQSLSTAEFLELAQAAIKPAAANPAELIADLRKEAVRRLKLTDFVADSPLPQLHGLRVLAGAELDAELKAALLSAIQKRGDELNALDFPELAARYNLESALAPSGSRWRPAACRMVAEWVAAHDVGLLNIQQCHWLLPRLNLSPSNTRSFRATWTGQLVPPRSGEFVFLTSPHHISTDEREDFYYRQSMQVSIEGKVILDSSPERWQAESAPVTLTANSPVAIQVVFDYECALDHRPPNAPVQTDRSPHAWLGWRGPGFTKATVPAAAFRQDVEGQPGLRVDYLLRYRRAEQNFQETAVEPRIDHAWMGGAGFIDLYPEARQAVADRLWQLAMAPSYWDDATATPADQPIRPQHIYLHHPLHAARMSAEQRGEFLRALLGRPEILDRSTLPAVYDVYHCYRYGAEDEAIAVLGEWMQRHANTPPRLASSSEQFYRLNRFRYRHLCIPALWIFPEHFEVLEQEYLRLPDGNCCLPVAYILAYGYLEQNKLQDWIDLLDRQLEEESVTGDARVNWLIARAMCAEIFAREASLTFRSAERPLAGMQWLDEAQLVAKSDAIRYRVARERAARLASMRRWSEAEAAVLAGDPEAEAVGAVLTEFKQQLAQQRVQEAAESQQALRKELERRRTLAQQRNDGAAMDQYNSYLEELPDDKTR